MIRKLKLKRRGSMNQRQKNAGLLFINNNSNSTNSSTIDDTCLLLTTIKRHSKHDKYSWTELDFSNHTFYIESASLSLIHI